MRFLDRRSQEDQEHDTSFNFYFCFVFVVLTVVLLTVEFPEHQNSVQNITINKVDWERPAENWMKLSFN